MKSRARSQRCNDARARLLRARLLRSVRRGAIIVWVILALPVIAVAMILLIDVARIWLARIELKNALDAASLSAVKTWGEGNSTQQARFDANDAFNANTILGNYYLLNTAEGTCTNGNDSDNDGNTQEEQILLGVATDGGTQFTFDCNSTPGCVTGTATAIFAVETDPNGDTFADPDGPVNPANPSGFPDTVYRLEQFTQTSGFTPLFVERIDLDLTGEVINDPGPVADNGYFDTRGAGSGVNADNQGGNAGPLVGVNDLSIGSTFAFLPPTISPIPGPNTTPQPRIMRVNFAGSGIPSAPAGTNEFFWGMDSDRVGFNTGGGGGTVAQDFGGDFGTGGGNGASNLGTVVTGSTVRITISGQTFTGTLVYINPNRSEITFNVTLTGAGSFAARAKRTLAINSISTSFTGLSWGPYNITGESYARFQCSAGPPQLFVNDIFSCTCP